MTSSTTLPPADAGQLDQAVRPGPEARERFEAWMRKHNEDSTDAIWRDAGDHDCYHYGATEAAWQAWQEAEAAERERWRGLLLDYFAVVDESWADVCAQAANAGLRELPITATQATAINKMHALRELVGPNVRANLTKGAADEA